jgi:hypothetical protein
MTTEPQNEQIETTTPPDQGGWLRRNGRILLFGVLLVLAAVIFTAFRAADKPALTDTGLEELDQRIIELAGGPVDYEIVSVQKSLAGSEDASFSGNVAFTGDANAINGCPEGGGGKDLWCVVLGDGITSENGSTYSRFLVQHLGAYWQVTGLLDSEASEFDIAGCDNWQAADS